MRGQRCWRRAVAHEESRGGGSVLEESMWGRRGDAREIDRAKRLTDRPWSVGNTCRMGIGGVLRFLL